MSPKSRIPATSASANDTDSPVLTGAREGLRWEDKENNLLREARAEGVFYKHIAIALQRTSLACRLHWHVIRYKNPRARKGDRRRQRTTRSPASTASGSGSTSNHQQLPLPPLVPRPESDTTMTLRPPPETPSTNDTVLQGRTLEVIQRAQNMQDEMLRSTALSLHTSVEVVQAMMRAHAANPQPATTDNATAYAGVAPPTTPQSPPSSLESSDDAHQAAMSLQAMSDGSASTTGSWRAAALPQLTESSPPARAAEMDPEPRPSARDIRSQMCLTNLLNAKRKQG